MVPGSNIHIDFNENSNFGELNSDPAHQYQRTHLRFTHVT
jgi:hypothetical protein